VGGRKRVRKEDEGPYGSREPAAKEAAAKAKSAVESCISLLGSDGKFRRGSRSTDGDVWIPGSGSGVRACDGKTYHKMPASHVDAGGPLDLAKELQSVIVSLPRK
jgi:hypothetical protein